MGLSKAQAVSAAKLIKQAQRSGSIPKDVPHAGTILVGEQTSKAPARHGKNGLSATFVSGSNWDFGLDAGLLVDALTLSLLSHYRDSIMSGDIPDGSGAQKPLTEKVAKLSGRRGKVRGFNTGRFADNIRRSKITGTTVKAQSRILPPTDRNVFIATEAKRGNSYFSVQGTASEIIREVTDEFVRGGILGQNRTPNTGEESSGNT